MGSWRKLHSEEHHNVYSSPDIVWAINREGRTCGMYHGLGQMRNVDMEDLKGRDLSRNLCLEETSY
jgi:hypothetical protein